VVLLGGLGAGAVAGVLGVGGGVLVEVDSTGLLVGGVLGGAGLGFGVGVRLTGGGGVATEVRSSRWAGTVCRGRVGPAATGLGSGAEPRDGCGSGPGVVITASPGGSPSARIRNGSTEPGLTGPPARLTLTRMP
jgi:hypothetical protein